MVMTSNVLYSMAVVATQINLYKIRPILRLLVGNIYLKLAFHYQNADDLTGQMLS
jgi:hypothetical protein